MPSQVRSRVLPPLFTVKGSTTTTAMVARPVLVVRPNGQMEYWTSIQSAAESLGCSSYTVSLASREGNLARGSKVHPADGHIERIIRTAACVSPGSSVHEGLLPDHIQDAIKDGIPESVWRPANVERMQWEQELKRQPGPYPHYPSAQGQEEEEDTKEEQQQPAGREAYPKRGAEMEETKSTWMYLLLFLFLTALWFPKLGSIMRQPSGVVMTFLLCIFTSAQLRRHGRKIDAAFTNLLRPFVPSVVLKDLSLLVQLLVLNAALITAIVAATYMTSSTLSLIRRAAKRFVRGVSSLVLHIASSVFDKWNAWASMHRPSWIVTRGGQYATKVPAEWTAKQLMSSWLRARTADQLRDLLRYNEPGVGQSVDDALFVLYDYAMGEEALRTAARACVDGVRSTEALDRCFTCILLERP